MAKKSEPKLARVLFVGGSRDGTWLDVDVKRNEIQIIPQQSVEEVDLVDLKKDEEAKDAIKFDTELYTRRDFAFSGEEVSMFVLEDMSEYEAFCRVCDHYHPPRLIPGFVTPLKRPLVELEKGGD